MITKILLVGFALCILLSPQKTTSQTKPPHFRKVGCPVKFPTLRSEPEPPSPLLSPNYCFYQNTTCVPTKENWPYQFENRHRGSIYRKIKTRSWWHCGRACDPTTPCKYWTFRKHGDRFRACYLMKSCCPSYGDDYSAFQSGLVGCPIE